MRPLSASASLYALGHKKSRTFQFLDFSLARAQAEVAKSQETPASRKYAGASFSSPTASLITVFWLVLLLAFEIRYPPGDNRYLGDT